MPSPQSAIFREDSTHHYFLEYALRGGVERATRAALIGRALAVPDANSNLVVAFGRNAWSELAPTAAPEDFIDFHPILGRNDHTAPGTQGDVLFWIHGTRHDLTLARAMAIDAVLGASAALELELHGFNYLDSRDLTGFIDGTENPRLAEAREAAVIAPAKAGAGGCFVLTQQWTHDLAHFARLGVEEQERVIGRTKADSIELEDAPPTSHVRRTDVKIDGKGLKIYRRSTPFGGVRSNGLYFLGFSCELMRFAIQLDRMFGRAEDGLMDRLTEFSTPVSGSYWYAPPEESLVEFFGTAPQCAN